MPINRKYPLTALLEACRNYPLRPWEHLTFEYVMLGGLNDSADDARRVVRLLGNLKSVKVNLIPWNPGALPYRESSPEAIEVFRQILTDRGVAAVVRYSRGRDVMAACGQLALKDVGSSPLTVLHCARIASLPYANYGHHTSALRCFFPVAEQQICTAARAQIAGKDIFTGNAGFQELQSIGFGEAQEDLSGRRLLPPTLPALPFPPRPPTHPPLPP